jgi:GNAT superfamily N-acetyltransferase
MRPREGIVIRPAEARDLRLVQRLLAGMLADAYGGLLGDVRVAELSADWHAMAVLSTEMADPRGLFLVAETPAGDLLGHAFANMRRPDAVTVFRLFVDPHQQRRGVGSALLAAVADGFPAARRMRLDVDDNNADAIAFYARGGFAPVGTVSEVWRRLVRLEKPILRSAPTGTRS